MKGVIASIFSLIYAVFITGSVWTVQEAGDYTFSGYGEAYSVKNASHEPVKLSFKDINLLHFGKIIKHLAVAGKTKVPRGGDTPTVFPNFISDLSSRHCALATTTKKPELYPYPIFLKNRVLRI